MRVTPSPRAAGPRRLKGAPHPADSATAEARRQGRPEGAAACTKS
jgi:hypothetical protein